jgi:phage terminase small subunit
MAKQADNGKLTDKQRLFVKEYLVDLNATQAALRAGYSPKTAFAIGYENLTKHYIREAVEREMKKREQRIEITADRVLEEFAKIAFTNLPGIVDYSNGMMTISNFEELTDEQKACIKKFKVKTMTRLDRDGEATEVDTIELEMNDKLKALEKLGHHLGLFAPKVNAKENGDGGFTFEFVMPGSEGAK